MEKQNYKVSPEERATNMNYLKAAIPFLKQFDIFIDNHHRAGIFDKEKFLFLESALRLIKLAQVPHVKLKKDKYEIDL